MSKRLFSQITNDIEQDDKAAIPLSKSTPDLVNGIPLSGEDYLLTVRQQANACAKTVVAKPPETIKKVKLPQHFQFFNTESDEKEQANKTWREGFTKPFKSFQKHMQENKATKQHKEITAMDEAYQLLYKQKDMTILSTLSQHSILRILKFHIQWLNQQQDIELKCQWMFGLLVYLDPVLTSKNISILRDVSRECIKLRKSLPEQHIPLNVIITIIADTFGQADLL